MTAKRDLSWVGLAIVLGSAAVSLWGFVWLLRQFAPLIGN